MKNMDKYKNTYRIESARAQWWDYGLNGAYFITICTKNREHYFGEIVNGKMVLSETGYISEQEWLKTFEMRPDMNLEMGEFIVMPNHFHAIIVIGENKYNLPQKRNDATHCGNDATHCGRDATHCVSTYLHLFVS
jgi:putative transposase